jgi:hypothetical protein
MNEIKAADVNTGYGARGVPAFPCRFGSKTAMKWQKLATQGDNWQRWACNKLNELLKPIAIL